MKRMPGEWSDRDQPATDGDRVDLNRRRLLKAGVLTASIAATGGVQGTVAARSDNWEDLPLREQLNVVRNATQPYKKLENMGEAGYVSSPIPVVCSEGYHFDNVPLWDGQLDPERPESLFYVFDESGKLQLGGVEYILLTDLDENGNPKEPKPDLFNDESEPLEGPVLRGTSEADGWFVFEAADGLAFWDLHVWVHERNPDGVFHLPNHRYDDMPGCVPIEDL